MPIAARGTNSRINWTNPINWTSPLWSGVVACYMTPPHRIGDKLHDLIGNTSGTITGTALSIAPQQQMVCRTFAGSSSHYTSYTGAVVSSLPVSLCAVAYTNNLAGYGNIIGIRQSGGYGAAQLRFSNTGTANYYTCAGGSATTVGVTGTVANAVGQWRFLAAVSAATNDHKLYVDGVLDASSSSAITSSALSPNRLMHGMAVNQDSGTIEPLNGGILISWVYARAMRDSEVAAWNTEIDSGFPTVFNRFSPVFYSIPGYDYLAHPIGHWRLDEASGANNALDTSGNSRNLTQSSSPSSGTGKIGTARAFNGVNQYFVSAASQLQTGTNSFSVGGWLNLYSGGIDRYAIVGRGSGTGWSIGYSDAVQKLFFTVGDQTIYDTSAIAWNTWYHVFGTYSSISQTVNFYINGTLVGTATNGGTPGNTEVTLGTKYDTSANGYRNFWNGLLDSWDLWNGYAGVPGDATTLYGNKTGYDVISGGTGANASNALSSLRSITARINHTRPVANHSLNGSLIAWWLPLPSNWGGAILYDIARRNSGTLTSGPTWAPGPNVFQSVAFDGVNDYVNGGSPVGLNGAGAAYISGWIWRSSTGMTAGFGGCGGSTAGGDNRFSLLWNTDGKLYFSASQTGASGYAYITLGGTDWNHVILVFDGSQATDATRAVVYVNGVAQSVTYAGTVGATLGAVNPFWIGADASNRPCGGRCTDVRIGLRALSESEAYAIYNQSLRGHPDTLNRISRSATFQPYAGLTINKPTGHWRLDEGAGANDATDSSGNGYTLTQSGSPGGGVGKFGSARVLDGSTQYFRSTSARLLTGTSPFSVGGWFYLTSASSDRHLVSGRSSSDTIGWSLYYASSTGKVTFKVGSQSITSAVLNNAWYHVLGTYNNQNQALSLFVNGVLISMVVGSGTPGNSDVTLGALCDPSGPTLSNYWGGSLDLWSLWNGYTATSSDAATLYGANIAYDAVSGRSVMPTSNIRIMTARGRRSRINRTNPVSNHPLNAGLIGWWLPIDSNWGGSILFDLLNLGNATLVNTPAWMDVQNGFPAPNYVLASSQHAVLPANVSYNFGSSNFTMTARIKPVSVATYQIIIGKHADATNDDYVFAIGLTRTNTTSSGYVCYYGDATNAGGPKADTTGAAVVAGVWQDIGVTRVGSNYQIYVNGVATGTVRSSAVTYVGTDPPYFARRTLAGNPTYYTGGLTDIRMYRRGLSPAEMRELSLQSRAGHPDTLNRIPISSYTFSPAPLLPFPPPVSLWRLDEGVSSSNALDASDSGTSLTQSGTPGTAAGKAISARTINGTNQLFQSSHSALLVGTGSFSVAGWFTLAAIGTDRCILSARTTSNTAGWAIHYVKTSGRICFTVGNAVVPGLYVLPNTWYHLLATYSSSTQIASLYVNGNLIACAINSGTTGNTELTMGALYSASGPTLSNYWSGSLDLWSLWRDYVVTPADAVTLYNAGTTFDAVSGGSRLSAGISFSLRGKTSRINHTNPVAGHSLNGSLAAWWLPLPSNWGGKTLFDLKCKNNGSLASGQSWRQGQNGFQAVYFDGSSSLPCGIVPAYGIKPTTMEAVVKPTNLSSTRTIFGSSGGATGNLQLRIEPAGSLQLVIQGIINVGSGTAGVVVAGVWSHVVATYDSAGNYAFYVNGIPAGSGTNSKAVSSSNLVFGVGDFGGELFLGEMYGMSIRTVALSAGDVYALYSQYKRNFSETLNWIYPKHYFAPFSTLLSPTAQWRLDEDSGANDATDSSAHGYHLTQTGSPGSLYGKIGTARTFNGSNQYFQSTSSGLRVLTNSFSVGGWFYLDSVAGDQFFLSDSDVTSGSGWELQFISSTGAARFRVGTQSATSAASSITTSAWYHVLGVYDAVSTVGKLYLNGVLAATASANAGTVTSTNPVTLGARYTSSGATFDNVVTGRMDLWSLWIGYAATADDAVTLYRYGTSCDALSGATSDVSCSAFQPPRGNKERINHTNPVSNSVLNQDLRFWWLPLNNNIGSSVYRDVLRNANATFSSTGTSWTIGPTGLPAIKFSGTSSYATTAATVDLSAYSVVFYSFWANLTYPGSFNMVVEMSANAGLNPGFDIYNNGSSTLYFSTYGTTGGWDQSSFVGPTTGTWNYLTVQNDLNGGSGNQASFWINGIKQTKTGNPVTASNTGKFFGNAIIYFMSRTSSTQFMAGSLGDFRLVAGRNIGDNEAMALYRDALSGYSASLNHISPPRHAASAAAATIFADAFSGGSQLSAAWGPSLDIPASGTATLLGAASPAIGLTPEGGIVLDGTTPPALGITPSGGSVLGSTNEATADYAPTAEGGEIASGEADQIVAYGPTAEGGEVLGGSSSAGLAFSESAEGGNIVSGAGEDIISYSATASGTVTAAGVATDEVAYILLASGVAVADGTSDASIDFGLTFAGGVALSGESLLALYITSLGGTVLSGSETDTAAYAVVMSGLIAALSSGTPILDYALTFSGEAALSGSITTTLVYDPSISGSVVLDGSASPVSVLFVASGGITLSGTGSDAAVYAPSMTGTATAEGSGSVGQAMPVSALGSAAVSGDVALDVVFVETASNGVVLSGVAATVQPINVDTSGGAIASGTSLPALSLIMEGGAALTETAATTAIYLLSASGTITTAGAGADAGVFVATFAGGAITSGTASDIADYAITATSGVTMAGSSSDATVYVFTAAGSAVLDGVAGLERVTSDTAAGGVSASGASSLNIEVYADGVVVLDGEAGVSGRLFTEAATGGSILAGTVTTEATYTPAASGSVASGGTSDAAGVYPAQMTADILTSGTSTAVISSAIAAAGGVLMSSNADALMIYVGTMAGSATTSGAAGLAAQMIAAFTGGLTASGDGEPTVQYAPESAADVSLSAAFPVTLTQVATFAGGLVSSGSGTVALDYFQATISGMSLLGQSGIQADYALTPDGGAAASGTAGVTAELVLSSTASATLDGQCSAGLVFDFTMDGLISLFGEAIVPIGTAIYMTAAGGMSLSGIAKAARFIRRKGSFDGWRLPRSPQVDSQSTHPIKDQGMHLPKITPGDSRSLPKIPND